MSKENPYPYTQYLRLSLAALLLLSSNQTTSFANNITHDYQQSLKFSTNYRIEILAQSHGHLVSEVAKQYSVQAYSTQQSPQLLSAITRPLDGFIVDVILDDINNDQNKEIVVLIESNQADKSYLLLDAYSFDGKKIIWNKELPKSLLSYNMHTYLNKHEVPSDLPRNTAVLPLLQ